MSPLFETNDGSRPSGLELARRHTGELPATGEPAEVAFAASLKALPAPAFDFELIRAASHRIEEPRATSRPTTSWWRRLMPLLIPLAVAAVALVAIRPPEAPTNRVKGDADVNFLVLRDGEPLPGVEGMSVRPGERIQFTYRAAGLDSLVLLSMDGDGVLTVFYPEEGEEPEPIIPGDRHVLEGSIQLDDATGPEIFVAVFGPGSVEEARSLVLEAYERDGAAGIEGLEDTDPAIDVVRIEKSKPAGGR